MDLLQSLGNILNPNKNMSDIKNISSFEKLQSLSKDTIIHLLLCSIDNSNKMEEAINSAINDDNFRELHAILANGDAIAHHDDICCIVNENLSSEAIVSKFENLGIVPQFEDLSKQKRLYVVSSTSVLLGEHEEIPNCSDERFIELAENEGRIYSDIESFIKSFNHDDVISSLLDYIRMI